MKERPDSELQLSSLDLNGSYSYHRMKDRQSLQGSGSSQISAQNHLSFHWLPRTTPQIWSKVTFYQEAAKVGGGWRGRDLSISQLGETEHVTGIVLKPKGEKDYIHVITLGTEFHYTQTKGSRNTKKGCCRLEHSQELCLDRGTNISNSDLQICRTITKCAPSNPLHVFLCTKAGKEIFITLLQRACTSKLTFCMYA